MTAMYLLSLLLQNISEQKNGRDDNPVVIHAIVVEWRSHFTLDSCTGDSTKRHVHNRTYCSILIRVCGRTESIYFYVKLNCALIHIGNRNWIQVSQLCCPSLDRIYCMSRYKKSVLTVINDRQVRDRPQRRLTTKLKNLPHPEIPAW